MGFSLSWEYDMMQFGILECVCDQKGDAARMLAAGLGAGYPP